MSRSGTWDFEWFRFFWWKHHLATEQVTNESQLWKVKQIMLGFHMFLLALSSNCEFLSLLSSCSTRFRYSLFFGSFYGQIPCVHVDTPFNHDLAAREYWVASLASQQYETTTADIRFFLSFVARQSFHRRSCGPASLIVEAWSCRCLFHCYSIDCFWMFWCRASERLVIVVTLLSQQAVSCFDAAWKKVMGWG